MRFAFRIGPNEIKINLNESSSLFVVAGSAFVVMVVALIFLLVTHVLLDVLKIEVSKKMCIEKK